ncbi:hypothetical protein MRB53_039500 [Persea americana]|nr:hypothetical protein MRB53_039500 [Persea americana]
MALTAGILHSDHVNYLILRYLQECGHEDTARAFFHDWHRSKEFRNPEDLPFANAVHRSELVNVIQNGLRHDEVQSRITQREKRFGWLDINPQRRELNGEMEMEYATSRPSSSGKRKSLSGNAGARLNDEPVKRQRLSSSGQDPVMINGHRDAMVIDAISPSGDVEDEDAVSPAVASEGAETVPTLRYDSVTTQTEVMASQKMPLPGWRNRAVVLRKPGARVFHASWSPQNDIEREAPNSTLVAAGESICRLYKTPQHIDDELRNIEHVDEPGLQDNSFITAMTWHPSGNVVTCAVDGTHHSAIGKDMAMRVLISLGRDRAGTITHLTDLPLLQPPGIVFRLERWTGNKITTSRLRIFDFSLSDAAWSGDKKIAVCGRASQVSILKLTDEIGSVLNHTAETIVRHNFTEQQPILPEMGPVATTYRHDTTNDLDIFIMHQFDQLDDVEQLRQDRIIIADPQLYNTPDYIKSNQILPLNRDFTTAAIQPRSTISIEPQARDTRLLAVCDQDGRCEVHALSRMNGAAFCQSLFNAGGQTFELAHHRPILAASWSPDGRLLALAGFDLLQIWQIEYITPNTLENRAVMTWEAKKFGFEELPHQNGSVNGMHDVDGINGSDDENVQPVRPVVLNWCGDGRKIVLAVDEKVCLSRRSSDLDNPPEMIVSANERALANYRIHRWLSLRLTAQRCQQSDELSRTVYHSCIFCITTILLNDTRINTILRHCVLASAAIKTLRSHLRSTVLCMSCIVATIAFRMICIIPGHRCTTSTNIAQYL